MPKTLMNSTRCSCCHRLMPRKTGGKRKTCSAQCDKAATKEAHRQRALRRLETRAAKSMLDPAVARARA